MLIYLFLFYFFVIFVKLRKLQVKSIKILKLSQERGRLVSLEMGPPLFEAFDMYTLGH